MSSVVGPRCVDGDEDPAEPVLEVFLDQAIEPVSDLDEGARACDSRGSRYATVTAP
jgi:hypothetical protein